MKGKFRPKNKAKYKGDPTNIIYRSGYEFTFMRWCDTNASVVEWSSEEVVIPYRSVLDEAYERAHKLAYKRYHRYFVDFYVKLKESDGSIHKYLVEVKPLHQTKAPDPKAFKSKKSFEAAQMTWLVNEAKWNAAREYCADRNLKFKIITEVELYGRKPGK